MVYQVVLVEEVQVTTIHLLLVDQELVVKVMMVELEIHILLLLVLKQEAAAVLEVGRAAAAMVVAMVVVMAAARRARWPSGE